MTPQRKRGRVPHTRTHSTDVKLPLHTLPEETCSSPRNIFCAIMYERQKIREEIATKSLVECKQQLRRLVVGSSSSVSERRERRCASGRSICTMRGRRRGGGCDGPSRVCSGGGQDGCGPHGRGDGVGGFDPGGGISGDRVGGIGGGPMPAQHAKDSSVGWLAAALELQL